MEWTKNVLIVGSVCAALAVASTASQNMPKRQAVPADSFVFRPAPEAVRLLDMGYGPFCASMYWVDLIMGYADVFFERGDMSRIEPIAELVIALDPDWIYPYEFSGLVFDGSSGTDRATGIRIMRKGIERHPDQWRLRVYCAMSVRAAGGTPEDVATLLQPIATGKLKGPEFAQTLAFTILAKGGLEEKALQSLVQTMAQVDDPMVQMRLQQKFGDLIRKSGYDLGQDSAAFVGAVGELLSPQHDRHQVEQLSSAICLFSDTTKRAENMRFARSLASQYREFQVRR